MYLLLKMPARSAARKHIRICKIKIIPRTWLTFLYTCDILEDELYEFIIILVFLPVYITKP
jgi:hypothetical protein